MCARLFVFPHLQHPNLSSGCDIVRSVTSPFATITFLLNSKYAVYIYKTRKARCEYPHTFVDYDLSTCY